MNKTIYTIISSILFLAVIVVGFTSAFYWALIPVFITATARAVMRKYL